MKTKVSRNIPYIWLSLIVIGLMVYMYFFFMNTCNDDASAEMILSKLLATEGGIISKDWQYSTEIRVFNTQLVFSFLFHLTDSWKWVRVLGNGLLYIGIIVCTYYLCFTLNIKKYFPIVAAMMILPLSREYFEFATHGTYLIPHLIISILSLALFIDVQERVGKNRNIRLAFMGILAFVAGLGGVRHILVLYLPILVVAIINGIFSLNNKKKITNIIYVLAVFLISLIGYIINRYILCVKYHVAYSSIESYGSKGDFLYSDFHFSRLEEVINGWLKCFGFQVGKKVISIGTINNGLTVLIVILAIYAIKSLKIQNDKTKTIVLFWLVSSLIISMLFIFTDKVFYPRYLFQTHVFLFPTIAACFENNKLELKSKKILVVLFSIYVTFVATYNLYEFVGENYTIGMREAVNQLVEEGYTEGYSTESWYWGNGMIEYSNGRLYTHRLSTDNGENYHEMNWLNQISLEKQNPKHKVYFVTTKDINVNNFEEIIYEYDDKIVYGYKSYEELVKDFKIEY